MGLALSRILEFSRSWLGRRIILIASLPLAVLFEIINLLRRVISNLRLRRIPLPSVEERIYPAESAFDEVLDQMEKTGRRYPASPNHENFMSWIESKLREHKSLELHRDPYQITKWEIENGREMEDGASITLSDGSRIHIASATPLSRPGEVTTQLIYVDPTTPLSSVVDQIRGKIVLRDMSYAAPPYTLLSLISYSKTPDMYRDTFKFYDRPHSAEMPMHHDLLAAGEAGAAGVIHVFDIVGSQVEGYFEPHQGTFYPVPGVIVGVDAGEVLKGVAKAQEPVTLAVHAVIEDTSTANIVATLPGMTEERAVFVTHTDGNTLVQENGVACLLTLVQYFAAQPLSSRRRTIEFYFTSAHLQVSRDGCGRHAKQLRAAGVDDAPAVVIAVEHMGTREIVPVSRKSGPGRELVFTGKGEPMLWCVGPSAVMIHAVEAAIKRRNLDRTLVTRGSVMPNTSRVPTFSHFGGIGSFYHQSLIPTIATISGPWSLWAPKFGRSAVDVSRMRQQTLALADIYLALDRYSKKDIMGTYAEYRTQLAMGKPLCVQEADKTDEGLERKRA